MITKQLAEQTFDELAAMTMQLGRELEQKACVVNFGGNWADLRGALHRLADRAPFDPRDGVSLELFAGKLEEDLGSEVVGTKRHFVETHCDEFGVQGEVREQPVYSERGLALLDIQNTLTAFLAARDATLDRMAAELAVRRLLAAHDPEGSSAMPAINRESRAATSSNNDLNVEKESNGVNALEDSSPDAFPILAKDSPFPSATWTENETDHETCSPRSTAASARHGRGPRPPHLNAA